MRNKSIKNQHFISIRFYKYVETGRGNVSFYNDGSPSFSIDGKVATGTYSPVASDTLANFKALLIEQNRKGVNNFLRENVDDHYAQKYRTGSYEVPDAVSAYATALTGKWDDYKKAINAVTDIADLEDVSMVWPDLP